MRPLLNATAPAPSPNQTADGVAERVVAAHVHVGTPNVFDVDTATFASKDPSANVRRDAHQVLALRLLRWDEVSTVTDVLIEQFDDAAAAERFHLDDGERHCEDGDESFDVPGVTAAVGFRQACQVTPRRTRLLVRGAFRFAAKIEGMPWGRATRITRARARGRSNPSLAAKDRGGTSSHLPPAPSDSSGTCPSRRGGWLAGDQTELL